MTRITRILISSFDDFFIVNELHELHELLVSFVSFVDHLMTRMIRILVVLMTLFYFVFFVFSVGNPITMSDVSRTFFVPSCHEQCHKTFVRLS